MTGVRRHRADLPVRILVSACLLGEKVRYDGGHKRDAFLAEKLGKTVDFVPVCPEVECGLPVPREPMRLSGDTAVPRLLGIETGCDYTERMTRWTTGKIAELAPLDLHGYVCKKDSPSCGMERGNDAASPDRPVSGMFTKSFMDRFPAITVLDEAMLQDPALRSSFLEQALAMRRPRPD
ncbi:MAG: DUF523 domain-containing protein [Deltaproteobacteria bacterium]|nr:MAG: DUF523 domain-containing protein [Deltaproteobacteria bacterium]